LSLHSGVSLFAFYAIAAPTIFDDVDKLSPDVKPEEYPDGPLGIFVNDDEKLDCREDGKEFP